LTKAFNQVDTDKSGSIESGEIEAVLRAYYKSSGKTVDDTKIRSEAAAFLNEVDKNKDKKVNLEEFIDYFLQFCQ